MPWLQLGKGVVEDDSFKCNFPQTSDCSSQYMLSRDRSSSGPSHNQIDQIKLSKLEALAGGTQNIQAVKGKPSSTKSCDHGMS
jgi:hypothetical protein